MNSQRILDCDLTRQRSSRAKRLADGSRGIFAWVKNRPISPIIESVHLRTWSEAFTYESADLFIGLVYLGDSLDRQRATGVFSNTPRCFAFRRAPRTARTGASPSRSGPNPHLKLSRPY